MASTTRNPPSPPQPLARSTTLCTYLNGRVDDLRRMVPKALKAWDPDAIHQSRVTTRRLKAAVDVLEPVLPVARRRRFAKGLRRLRGALGPLRDIDVMLDHLDELKTRPKNRAAVEWLTKRLLQQRLEQRRKCTRKHPPKAVLDELGAWWGFEQDIAEVENATPSLLRRAVPTQLRAFSDRADRLARARVSAGSNDAPQPNCDDDVHALRIAGKLLRYTLELSTPAGYVISSSVLKSFKKLQDALGAWHDYVVLGEVTLEHALKTELAAHHGDLYGHCVEFARTLWNLSERELDKFSQLWRAHGQSVADEISMTFRSTTSRPAVESDASVRGPEPRSHSAEVPQPQAV